MTLAEAGAFIARWAWLLCFGVLAATIPTYVVSGRLPVVYEARARLSVDLSSTATAADPGQLGGQLMTTSMALIRSGPILNRAATQVPGLTAIDAADVDVQRVPDTPFLDVVIRRTDPNAAIDIANAVAASAVGQAEVDQAASIAARTDRLEALVAQRATALEERTRDVRDLRAQPADTARNLQLDRAQAQLDLAQQDYINAISGRDDARLAALSGTSLVSVAELASSARDVSSAQLPANLFVAAVLGLCIAIGVALLVDRVSDPLPAPNVLWRTTGVPVLGSMPRMAPEAVRDLVTRPDALPPSGAESIRLLRSAVLGALPEAGVGTLLVTSHRHGEGKTTIAAGLANALALAGRRVILVEPTPYSFASTAGHRAGAVPGLGMLLRNEHLHASSALLPSSNERLWTLSAGSTSSEAMANLYASRQLRQRLQELSTLAVVIVDDVRTNADDLPELVPFVDLIMVVVDPRFTSVRDVRAFGSRLREAGGAALGVVVNRVATRSAPYIPAGVDYLRATLEARGPDGPNALASTQRLPSTQ